MEDFEDCFHEDYSFDSIEDDDDDGDFFELGDYDEHQNDFEISEMNNNNGISNNIYDGGQRENEIANSNTIDDNRMEIDQVEVNENPFFNPFENDNSFQRDVPQCNNGTNINQNRDRPYIPENNGTNDRQRSLQNPVSDDMMQLDEERGRSNTMSFSNHPIIIQNSQLRRRRDQRSRRPFIPSNPPSPARIVTSPRTPKALRTAEIISQEELELRRSSAPTTMIYDGFTYVRTPYRPPIIPINEQMIRQNEREMNRQQPDGFTIPQNNQGQQMGSPTPGHHMTIPNNYYSYNYYSYVPVQSMSPQQIAFRPLMSFQIPTSTHRIKEEKPKRSIERCGFDVEAGVRNDDIPKKGGRYGKKGSNSPYCQEICCVKDCFLVVASRTRYCLKTNPEIKKVYCENGCDRICDTCYFRDRYRAQRKGGRQLTDVALGTGKRKKKKNNRGRRKSAHPRKYR